MLVIMVIITAIEDIVNGNVEARTSPSIIKTKS